jgi:hypothetical protein
MLSMLLLKRILAMLRELGVANGKGRVTANTVRLRAKRKMGEDKFD